MSGNTADPRWSTPQGPPGLSPDAVKVMIVDDDPTTVEAVQGQLAAAGYRQFVVCSDPREALELIARQRPDVLLLDIVMPELNGLEILRRVRDSEETAHLPVIILTAFGDKATRLTALQMGATDFIGKPVDFVELAPRIRNAAVVKAYHDQWKRQAEELRRQVELQTASLRESHAALERANLVLRRSCAAAEAATRAKSEFLANTSHEIRTPLTAIIGFAEELLIEAEEKGVSPPCVEMLRIVLRNGRHLLGIVNDILDVARIEKGLLSIDRVACSPAAVVAEVETLLRPAAEAKGLAFHVSVDPQTPASIHSDPGRLQQILVNLVGNAVKFTQRGEVRVRVRPAGDDGQRLLFEVADTGIGIEPQYRGRIFEPFAQIRVAGDKHAGTGLGLTICKYLAEELGGGIEVESQPGVGSTFRATIATRGEPRGEKAGDARPAEAAGCSTTAAVNLSCRVLVAEDSPDTQRLIRLILEKAGATVAAVGDGLAAFEAAVAARGEGRPFDVVLTDIQMPLLDGYELAARLRHAGHRGPIVALTANAMHGERERCLAAGCDDYLCKPIDRNELLRLVARYAPQIAPAT